MPLNRSDLADLFYFQTIAQHKSFSRAAIELGVSASALSHALKGLENRLGVRLLNRTTKSVTLTGAGDALFVSLDQPFETISSALEALNRFRDSPAGRIRLNVAVEAATLLLGPVLADFSERYPDIILDIVANNRIVDVTEGGFDAGIRYGGTVPEGMIAQRLSNEIRWVVVGSPQYLQRFGVPQHPDDLQTHRCISSRLGDDRIYRWEFQKDNQAMAIAVPLSITVDHAETGLVAVLRGAGLMYLPEPLVQPYVQANQLSYVLSDWAPVEPGFHIYFSGHRQVPTGLRLLIELVRELKPLGYE